jgi:hypothetical protein
MSRDKLDTGTGGFSVTVNNSTNRYTFDTGSTVGDEPPVPWSPGDINVNHENKDVSQGTKRTLASYLSKTTMGQTPSSPTSVKNKYEIKHNENQDPNIFSLKDERGFPQPLSPSSEEQPHFVDAQPGDSRSSAAANLNVLRGRQPVDIIDLAPRDGNTLLKDVELVSAGDNKPYQKLSDTDPVGVYSRSLLNNRFTSDNFYPTKPETSQLRDAQYAYKYPLGKSLPPESPERNISYGRLAQIGNALSIRAGLELKSLDPGNNPTDNAAVAGAILPGSTQLGVYRLEREQLEAASILESLTSENIEDNLLINPAKQSWGTLNNVLDQYAGISNFGMQLLAIALIVALSLVITFIGNLLPGSDKPINNRGMDDKGIRPLGASYETGKRIDYSSIASIVSQGSDFNIWGLLGFPQTIHSLGKSVSVGTLLFFGIVPPKGSDIGFGNLATQATLGGATSAMKNPGYYTIMARSINRSFLLIGDSLLSLGKSFASGNFVTGMQQSLEFVNVFRESKFMGSLRVFSRLGDAYLYDAEDPQISDDGRHKTRLDKMSDADVLKGRMTGTTRQAWSSHRARDLLIYPSGLKRISPVSAGKLDGNIPRFISDDIDDFAELDTSSGAESRAYFNAGDNNRISSDVREEMEEALDSEYVPFYFHDVRTNEILSFHAFLSSLSDDYSSTYDSSEGFGRVEPVKIYKGTQRKIGFSFYIAATSEVDFNVMWEKINKLVTLVYPQYTEGRILTTEDKKYNIQMPFSQTIQASPMVRVRIGDLVRSNYSKFNLARLFGYSYANTKFDDATAEDAAASKSKDAVKGVLFDVGNTFRLYDKHTHIWDFIVAKNLLGTKTTDPREQQLKAICETEIPPALVLAIVEHGDEESVFEVTLDEPEVNPESYDTLKDEPGATTNIRVKLKNSLVYPTAKTNRKVDQFYDKGRAYDVNAVKFMDEKENSVVRSFRSSGGKGLAGFIESMSFDWYDRVTWEVAGSSGKSPKMCKVTISFSPVHDITPGLDHEGGNRAPVYPVGGFFRK